ncbi:MAG: TIGR04211 family SH3 domain-containing protein [Planctomycetes bacterium]|nr:TIGR04211 family SH3 domain-containing protein [Planctomycetota bacterium]
MLGRTSLAAGVSALFVVAPLLLLLSAPAVSAEAAWVRGGIRLNLRTEPGTQFRIIGGVSTGDAVDVIGRIDGWTQIRLPNGSSGWIPEGYLQPKPPPTVRLEQLEDEVTKLRAQLEASNAQTAELGATNEILAGRDGGQRSEIDRLKVENSELRANKRWPEWITGASVLAAGMLLGAILHRNATRRPSSRIRL